MSTILPTAPKHNTRGVLLIEIVSRFYFELLRCALWSIRSCRVPDPATSREDIAQEAILRLMTRSPPGWLTDAPTLGVLNAWVKRCSWRLCADMSRRADRRGPHGRPDWSEVKVPASTLSPSQPPSPLEELVAASQAAIAARVLRASYPRGAQLLELVLVHPDATADELAALMGTSRANVHQIRSRARVVLRGAGLGVEAVETLSL